MQNPYGAVPEAIKDMRVSLRDIMADVLATKKMEGDLSLARAKAETDTALINAENERHKLANEKDIARMQQQDTQFNRQLDQSASQFQQTQTLAEAAQRFSQGPAFDETRRVNTAHVRHLNAQTAELGRKAREDAEVVTAQQYATERGAVHLLPMFGIDPNQKMTRKQFEGFGSQIDAMVRSNPMIMVIANGKKLQTDLENLSAQYKTPGLDAATKEKIGGDIKAKREQLEKLDYFIMAAKEPDAVKVAAEAHKTWTDNPDLATQYKNYDEYHQAFADSIRTARGHFHEGINNIKFFEATKDISPTYREDMQQALTAINALPDTHPKKAGIVSHINKLTADAKKDPKHYKALYDYAMSWGKYLSAPPATIAPAAAPSAQPTVQSPAPSLSTAARTQPGDSISQGNAAGLRQSVSPAAEEKEIQALADFKLRQTGISKKSPQYARAQQIARVQAEKEVRPRYASLREAAERHIARGDY